MRFSVMSSAPLALSLTVQTQLMAGREKKQNLSGSNCFRKTPRFSYQMIWGPGQKVNFSLTRDLILEPLWDPACMRGPQGDARSPTSTLAAPCVFAFLRIRLPMFVGKQGLRASILHVLAYSDFEVSHRVAGVDGIVLIQG